jgi:hypothetical protein
MIQCCVGGFASDLNLVGLAMRVAGVRQLQGDFTLIG